MELLIVVVIIAILTSMTLACVAVLREQASRVSCMNNQRSWGVAILSKAADNRGAVPSSHLQINRACPEILALNNRSATLTTGIGGDRCEFTIADMAGYMEGGDAVFAAFTAAAAAGNYGNLADAGLQAKTSSWRCPSQRSGFSLSHASAYGAYSDYIVGLGYAYFGRTDLWTSLYQKGIFASGMASPENLEQLVGRIPQANQVMMNDLLFSWTSSETYGPNHVKSFSSKQARTATGDFQTMSGNNTLYGDGRVAWKTASAFLLTDMQTGNLTNVPHTEHFSNGYGHNFW